VYAFYSERTSSIPNWCPFVGFRPLTPPPPILVPFFFDVAREWPRAAVCSPSSLSWAPTYFSPRGQSLFVHKVFRSSRPFSWANRCSLFSRRHPPFPSLFCCFERDVPRRTPNTACPTFLLRPGFFYEPLFSFFSPPSFSLFLVAPAVGLSFLALLPIIARFNEPHFFFPVSSGPLSPPAFEIYHCVRMSVPSLLSPTTLLHPRIPDCTTVIVDGSLFRITGLGRLYL